MKKIFMLIAFLLAVSITPETHASEKIAGRSAQLTSTTEQKDRIKRNDARVKALQNVFKKYDSTLVAEAEHYVYYADKHGIDWKLLPAIAGLESTFAKRFMPGSYNAYGWGGGHIYFESWEDGINQISKSLSDRYYARGADTVWEIGPIYAESPTWAVRVNRFMSEINDEYLRLTTLSAAPVF